MSATKLTADFFCQNRRHLAELLPKGSVAVIPAYTRVERRKDVAFPFSQSSNFFYLTGINRPDCLLILVSGQFAHDFLIIPNPSERMALWEGETSAKSLQATSGVEEVVYKPAALEKLRPEMRDKKKLYLPFSYTKQQLWAAPNPANRATRKWFKNHWPEVKQIDLRPELAKLRVVKKPVEIDLIQAAIDLTERGLRRTWKLLRPGVSEYQLEAELLRSFRSENADIAWNPIIASGANACVIHYNEKNGTVKKDELVLFDVGAETNNYGADISRTLPASGKFSPRQREVYQAVLEIQMRALQILRPGITFIDWQTQVDQLTAQALVQLKLLTPAELKRDPKAFRKYYPHMSHFLGLDVHDVGDYRQPFAPGMVLTVEPGIYIAEEGIGIRLEDDVLITPTGARNLSANIPVEIRDIERLFNVN